jgi:hypothetical protein
MVELIVVNDRLRISTASSLIEGGQYTNRTRKYGVFRLILTGVDNSAVIDAPETLALVPRSREAVASAQIITL